MKWPTGMPATTTSKQTNEQSRRTNGRALDDGDWGLEMGFAAEVGF